MWKQHIQLRYCWSQGQECPHVSHSHNITLHRSIIGANAHQKCIKKKKQFLASTMRVAAPVLVTYNVCLCHVDTC